MTAVLGDEVGVGPRSQISLRSVEDSTRWFEILSQDPEGSDTVFGLHVSGAGSFPSLLTWPKLKNLRHLELQGIDFRDSSQPITPFNAYFSSIDELVLEGLRFEEVDGLFALISPFNNLVSLVIHDVEWGKDGLLDDDEAEPGSEDETHRNTMQPSDCCSITNSGSLHPVNDSGIDLPTLKHLSLRGCSSTIAKQLTQMPSKLHLSRLEISWEDEHLFPLSEMIEACAPSLSELSISGVFHTGTCFGLEFLQLFLTPDSVSFTECDRPLSLSSCTRLSFLYLNGIHLFLDEPLGPALYHLTSTLPGTKNSGHPLSINLCFTLDVGPAWASHIDDIDWDAAGTALASLESRLEEGKDHWSVTIEVDPSYLSISEDEERRIREALMQKLERFSAVLQLDIR